MIYGLYLSATGVLTNSYRQDVIANNLANSETVGFRRSLALFQQRPTQAQEQGDASNTNPLLEPIGGGLLASPTYIDQSAGPEEQTGNPLDVAIGGDGFFAVQNKKDLALTRNGRFMLDKEGYLILADGSNHRVLDNNKLPIQLPQATAGSQVTIARDGEITVNEEVAGQIGLFDAPDKSQLHPLGGTLIAYPDAKKLRASTTEMRSGFIEGSNVDPMTELTQLIESQRQLEANANMIRFQDQTLSKLVNEAGKIG